MQLPSIVPGIRHCIAPVALVLAAAPARADLITGQVVDSNGLRASGPQSGPYWLAKSVTVE